jgi:5-methylcytosine-specific restriction endonuclease McrA
VGNYYAQLKDKRWFKKRDKIIKRDNGLCTVCGSPKHLVVHHTYYLPLRPPPWAYPDDSLLTLCWDCHEKYHQEHELTINSYHSDRKGRKPFKKRTSKKEKRKKETPPETRQQKARKERKKKKQLGFNLDKLEEKLGITARRRWDKH